jgi:hypothetical protein
MKKLEKQRVLRFSRILHRIFSLPITFEPKMKTKTGQKWKTNHTALLACLFCIGKWPKRRAERLLKKNKKYERRASQFSHRKTRKTEGKKRK